VAGCICDGGMGERFLLFLFNRLVVGVQAYSYQAGDEGEKNVLYVDSTRSMMLALCLGLNNLLIGMGKLAREGLHWVFDLRDIVGNELRFFLRIMFLRLIHKLSTKNI